MANEACSCCGGTKLIFACSGAADVGAISDQAARQISREGKAKMFCLAGVGGRVPAIMQTVESAAKVLAVDGCPLNCAKNTLEQAGFKRFEHLQVASFGMEKGKTPVTPEVVAKIALACAEKLQ
ncbi:MAG TPA: putative zinc-binding protein [Planctomycetota bacterium]|jgi:uncharacterized metal-binding protein